MSQKIPNGMLKEELILTTKTFGKIEGSIIHSKNKRISEIISDDPKKFIILVDCKNLDIYDEDIISDVVLLAKEDIIAIHFDVCVENYKNN